MKVILTTNIKKLGKIGELVKVKDGYARNFLFQKKMALRENKKNIEQYEKIKKFTVCDRLFELERGEITPSLKIKRKVVSENFKDVIDAMYDNPKSSE